MAAVRVMTAAAVAIDRRYGDGTNGDDGNLSYCDDAK